MKKYNYDEMWEYLRQLKDKKFMELEKKAQETDDWDDFDEYVDKTLMWKHFDIDNTDNGTGYCEMEYKLKELDNGN